MNPQRTPLPRSVFLLFLGLFVLFSLLCIKAGLDTAAAVAIAAVLALVVIMFVREKKVQIGPNGIFIENIVHHADTSSSDK